MGSTVEVDKNVKCRRLVDNGVWKYVDLMCILARLWSFVSPPSLDMHVQGLEWLEWLSGWWSYVLRCAMTTWEAELVIVSFSLSTSISCSTTLDYIYHKNLLQLPPPPRPHSPSTSTSPKPNHNNLHGQINSHVPTRSNHRWWCPPRRCWILSVRRWR